MENIQAILFDEVYDKYGFLSNYYKAPFILDEKEWATSEHYF